MEKLLQRFIQRIIPHRYPFLLVDRVTELEPGKRIVGIKRFTANENFGNFQAGFQVPTGILLEAVTQLGAILVLNRPEMAGKIAVILQILSAQMLPPAGAGETPPLGG